MEDKLNSFFESNYLLFENQGTDNEDDLSTKLINSILKKGIDGLDEFKSEFTPNKFKQLRNSILDILKKHTLETRVSFSCFIENYLKRFNVLKEDNLRTEFVNILTKDVVESLDYFDREIEPDKLRSLKENLISFQLESNCECKDFDLFFIYLLKSNTISDDQELINNICKKASKCFVEALEHFKEDIAPKSFQAVVASLLSDSSESTDSPKPSEPIRPTKSAKKSKIDLKTLKENFEEFKPTCAEQCILKLIFFLNLKFLQEKSEISEEIAEYCSLEISDNLIDEEFELLTKRISLEQLDLRISMEQANNKKKRRDWISTVKELEKLLKILRPLNVSVLKHLISKAKKAADLILNQDIILLLGPTGSGKSTTIHFLAGSKMVESEVELEKGKKLKHITPVEPFKCEELKNVAISSRAESETRYINAIPIQFSWFVKHDKRTTILCDTPGFEDTAGPEVDIANGIGVLEAIKGCNSVKPVILISYLTMGDKGQGIKKLAHLLVRMIGNIEDELDSFSYIFTKFPSNVDINTLLSNIKETSVDLNPEESEDEPYNALFVDILNKTENSKSLDPLKDKPMEILSYLKRSACIKNPKNCFNFSLGENSRIAVNEQVRLNHMNIISATKRGEFELADKYLSDIKYLKETIKDNSIDSIFKSSIDFIEENIGEEFTQSREDLNRNLENCIKLNIEDVKQYKRKVDKFARLNVLESFKVSAHFSEAMVTNLENKTNDLLRTVENLNLGTNIRDIKIILDNIKLIGQVFKELDPIYVKICAWEEIGILHRKLKVLMEEIEKSLLTNDFNNVTQKLTVISNTSKFLGEHVNSSKLEEMYKSSVLKVKEHLLNALTILNYLLEKEEKLNKSDIEKLKSLVEMIEFAQATKELRDHIEKVEIDEIFASFFTIILKYFISLDEEIENLFKFSSDNYFRKVEMLIEQMNDLRTISIISLRTSEVYQARIQKIIAFVQQLNKDAERILDNFYNQSENVDYSQLFRCMNVLKSADWVNKLKEGVYEDIMKNLHEDLSKHSRKLYDVIIDSNISLENYSILEIVNKNLKKLEKMQPLEGNLKELVQYRENAQKKVKDDLEKCFRIIRDNFDLKKQSVNEESKIYRNLKKIRDDYNKLLPSSIYLNNEGFSSEKSLNEEIDKINSEMSNNKINTIQLEQQVIQLSNILKEYAECSTKLDKEGEKRILNKFKSMIELTEEIDKCKADINKLEKHLKDNLELKLESLEEVKRKYFEISNSSQISIESKEYLEKFQYKSLVQLNEEISSKKEQLKDLTLRGVQYVFKRMDMRMTENTLNFLHKCKNIRFIRDNFPDAGNFIISMEAFLNEYRIYIEKEMNNIFERLQNLPSNSISATFYMAHKLKGFVNDLTELNSSDKFLAVKEVVKSSELIKQWREKVKTNLMDLEEQLDKDEVNKKELKNNLNRIKAMVLLDDRYSDLYSKYRTTINTQFKECYTKISDYSDTRDYKKVAMELIEIDDAPINEKAFGQAMHFLSSSITDLLAEIRILIVKLTNNLEKETIASIVKGFDQLENARKYLTNSFDEKNLLKFKTKSFLDEETKKQLTLGFENSITSVSKKVKTYLDQTVALIDNNNFFEAEERKDYYVNTVRELLGSYCDSEDINDQFLQIQTKLESTVDTVFTKYDDMPIEKYMLDPPKYILQQLEKVSIGNYKYTKVLKSARESLISKLRKELDNAKDAMPEESNKSMRIVQSALSSLPDDLKNIIEYQMKDIEQVIKNRNEDYYTDFNSIITSHDVKAIHTFMQKCSDNGMNKFLKLISEEILKKANDLKDGFKNSLENENMKAAVDSYKKLYEYKDVFGKNMSQIDTFFNETNKQLMNKFDKITSVLIGINVIERAEQGEESFDSFCKIMELKSDKELTQNSQEIEEVFLKISEKLDTVYNTLSEYILNNQSNFENSIKNLNIPKLKESMNNMKKWNTLIKQIKRFASTGSDYAKAIKLEKINDGKSYQQMKDGLNTKLRNLKDQVLKFEPLIGFEKELDNFYKELEINVVFIKNAIDINEHIDGEVFSLKSFSEEIFPYLSKQNENLTQKAVEIIELNQLNRKDFDDLRINLSNLASFEKYSRSIGLETKKCLEKITQKLREKIDKISLEVKNPKLPLDKVCSNIISLKILADNIPLHKEIINQNIDHVLDVFRRHNKNDGGLALAKLSILLERDPNGVGLTIISEHSIFKGQSISLFNQETKRHGIDHVLSHLDGDGLDTEKLRELYERFDKDYKELVKDNINRLEKKNEIKDVLDNLVSKIKFSVKDVKQKPNQIKWDANIRFLVPSLMANIFALWTIKSKFITIPVRLVFDEFYNFERNTNFHMKMVRVIRSFLLETFYSNKTVFTVLFYNSNFFLIKKN